jgi:hypothetical protein
MTRPNGRGAHGRERCARVLEAVKAVERTTWEAVAAGQLSLGAPAEAAGRAIFEGFQQRSEGATWP